MIKDYFNALGGAKIYLRYPNSFWQEFRDIIIKSTGKGGRSLLIPNQEYHC